MSNYKEIPGKDIGNNPLDPDDTSPLKFEIATDDSVVGAGMPITMALCRKIVSDYHTRQMEVYEVLKDSESEAVKAWVNPEYDVVSGVYGKETLLHILEQEGCDGIRYVNCVYGGQKSIVLFGVDKDGEPIGERVNFMTDNPDKTIVIYEVKGGSKTLAEFLELFLNPRAEHTAFASNDTDKILNALL